MITKLSEVVQISSLLKYWDGKQNKQFPTSNAKLQKYKSTGEDSPMNVVLFKFIALNDLDAYEKLLQSGVSVFYQTVRIDVIKKSNLITCQVYNKLNQESGLIHVDDNAIFHKQRFTISGTESTVLSMFEYNQKGKSREITGRR